MECNNCEIFGFFNYKFLFFSFFFVMKRHENRWPTVNYPVRSTQNFSHRSRPVARVDWWPSKWKPNNPSKVNAQFIVTFYSPWYCTYMYQSIILNCCLRSHCDRCVTNHFDDASYTSDCTYLFVVRCAQKAQQRTHARTAIKFNERACLLRFSFCGNGQRDRRGFNRTRHVIL